MLFLSEMRVSLAVCLPQHLAVFFVMGRKLFILRSEHTTEECVDVTAQEIVARERQSVDLPTSRKCVEIQ